MNWQEESMSEAVRLSLWELCFPCVLLPAICFSFHKFFDEDSTQEKIYHNSVCPLIPLMLQGQNASVFAYGPTGAGMESFYV